MTRFLTKAAGWIIGMSTGAAMAQPLDILQIFDQFAVSNAVASKCVKPDGDKLAKFLLNFQIVWINASLNLSKASSDMTPERADQALKDRYADVDKKVTEIIGEESCDGPRVKEALHRFDVQSSMDLTGARKSN